MLAAACAVTVSAAAYTNPSAITINDSPWCGTITPGTGSITITDNAIASPYPTTAEVSDAVGTVTDVNVILFGFSHTNPDDVDILLVGPNGAKVVLMSDVGGSADVSGLDLTIDSQAAASFPDTGPLVSGAFKPTDFEVIESFPAPAPANPYGSDLSAFNGANPNGTWSVYVVDDSAGSAGSIASIALQITVSVPFPCSKQATPYPSTIDLTGVPGTVSDANVRLNGFGHTFPDDVDVLLVGPTGAKAVVMSDTGGGDAVTGLTITLDDEAATPLPNSTALSSGSFKPTDVSDGDDLFPSPAPAGPYTNSALSIFDATAVSGVWSLYVVDDAYVDDGSISAGWSLEIGGPTAVAVRAFHARAERRRIVLGWQTGEETETAGFNLYRSSPRARPQKLNKKLISAMQAGSARGTGYHFIDARVKAGVSYTYRLELVNLRGERTFARAVALRARG